MPTQIDLPVGIHRGVPAETYHALDLCSHHRLEVLARKTPAHLKWELDHPKQTEAMLLGEALHCMVLEPLTFERRFTVAGQCSATTKAGARCSNPGTRRVDGAWFCGVKGHAPGGGDAFAGKLLTQEQYENIHDMAQQIFRRDMSASLLANTPQESREVTVIWEMGGVNGRSRIDGWVTGELSDWNVIFDIKTTRDANPDRFARDIANFGYHRQADLYVRALASLGHTVETFVIIAVESEPPHAVACYPMRDEALIAASAQNDRLLAQYAETCAKGLWPGYEDRDISVPVWELKKEQED